jgi:hypothetical protein
VGGVRHVHVEQLSDKINSVACASCWDLHTRILLRCHTDRPMNIKLRVLLQNKINLRYCVSGWFCYRNKDGATKNCAYTSIQMNMSWKLVYCHCYFEDVSVLFFFWVKMKQDFAQLFSESEVAGRSEWMGRRLTGACVIDRVFPVLSQLLLVSWL